MSDGPNGLTGVSAGDYRLSPVGIKPEKKGRDLLEDRSATEREVVPVDGKKEAARPEGAPEANSVDYGVQVGIVINLCRSKNASIQIGNYLVRKNEKSQVVVCDASTGKEVNKSINDVLKETYTDQASADNANAILQKLSIDNKLTLDGKTVILASFTDANAVTQAAIDKQTEEAKKTEEARKKAAEKEEAGKKAEELAKKKEADKPAPPADLAEGEKAAWDLLVTLSGGKITAEIFKEIWKDKKVEYDEAKGLGFKRGFFNLVDKNMDADATSDTDSVGAITEEELVKADEVIERAAEILDLPVESIDGKMGVAEMYRTSESFRSISVKELKDAKEKIEKDLEGLGLEKLNESEARNKMEGLKYHAGVIGVVLQEWGTSPKTGAQAAVIIIRAGLASMTKMYDALRVAENLVDKLPSVFKPIKFTADKLISWAKGEKVDEKDKDKDKAKSGIDDEPAKNYEADYKNLTADELLAKRTVLVAEQEEVETKRQDAWVELSDYVEPEFSKLNPEKTKDMDPQMLMAAGYFKIRKEVDNQPIRDMEKKYRELLEKGKENSARLLTIQSFLKSAKANDPALKYYLLVENKQYDKVINDDSAPAHLKAYALIEKAQSILQKETRKQINLIAQKQGADRGKNYKEKMLGLALQKAKEKTKTEREALLAQAKQELDKRIVDADGAITFKEGVQEKDKAIIVYIYAQYAMQTAEEDDVAKANIKYVRLMAVAKKYLEAMDKNHPLYEVIKAAAEENDQMADAPDGGLEFQVAVEEQNLDNASKYMDRYITGLETAIAALEVKEGKTNSENKKLAGYYQQLFSLYKTKGNVDKAISYLDKAVVLLEKIEDDEKSAKLAKSLKEQKDVTIRIKALYDGTSSAKAASALFTNYTLWARKAQEAWDKAKDAQGKEKQDLTEEAIQCKAQAFYYAIELMEFINKQDDKDKFVQSFGKIAGPDVFKNKWKADSKKILSGVFGSYEKLNEYFGKRFDEAKKIKMDLMAGRETAGADAE